MFFHWNIWKQQEPLGLPRTSCSCSGTLTPVPSPHSTLGWHGPMGSGMVSIHAIFSASPEAGPTVPKLCQPYGLQETGEWQGREGRSEHSVSIIFSRGYRWDMTSEGLGEISAEAW